MLPRPRRKEWARTKKKILYIPKQNTRNGVGGRGREGAEVTEKRGDQAIHPYINQYVKCNPRVTFRGNTLPHRGCHVLHVKFCRKEPL